MWKPVAAGFQEYGFQEYGGLPVLSVSASGMGCPPMMCGPYKNMRVIIGVDPDATILPHHTRIGPPSCDLARDFLPKWGHKQ